MPSPADRLRAASSAAEAMRIATSMSPAERRAAANEFEVLATVKGVIQDAERHS